MVQPRGIQADVQAIETLQNMQRRAKELGIVFEDPPPGSRGSTSRRALALKLEVLREFPGRWAKIEERKSAMPGWLAKAFPGFEFTSRSIGGGGGALRAIYARYLGDEVVSAAGDRP